MSAIFDADGLKAWDDFTIKNEPITSLDLMERAATACTKQILGAYHFQSAAIICGVGNNGGDGLVIARLLALKGHHVQVYICHYSDKQSADFKTNLERLPKAVQVVHVGESNIPTTFESDLIIDAIFGTGLNREISGWLATIVDVINTSKRPIIAIDLPAGLFAGSNANQSLQNIIHAHRTFSFQTPKLPFFFQEYSDFVGKFTVLPIGLHPLFEGDAIGTFIEQDDILIKRKSLFGHKGNHGYLTVVAGLETMIGAGLITAEAAFKTGAGYVGVVANSTILTPLATRLPEAIYLGEEVNQFTPKTTALVIGPGLGTSAKSLALLKLALETTHPLVIDADGLNLLATNRELLEQLPKNTILTPHGGELVRLIGKFTHPEQVLERQRAFSKKYEVFVIQKGAFTKITTPTGELLINSTGNGYMATAGMGDALTGVIGGLLARGYTPYEAAKTGVYIHGLAGDIAGRKKGYQGLITTDVIQHIPDALNQF